MINDTNLIIDDVNGLKNELAIVKNWIENFDTTIIKELVDDYIATMIFIEITDSGYIVYYIPENWDDITFNTTGLDITISGYNEYGRLVLTY